MAALKHCKSLQRHAPCAGFECGLVRVLRGHLLGLLHGYLCRNANGSLTLRRWEARSTGRRIGWWIWCCWGGSTCITTLANKWGSVRLLASLQSIHYFLKLKSKPVQRTPQT